MHNAATDDFIGAGWAFPTGTGPTGGIALVSREQELGQAIRLILATQPGERPMRPEFGCPLRDFVFREIGPRTTAELSHVVRNALMRWEPRIDVHTVTVTPDTEEGSLLHIDIQYTVKTTNDHRNLVFPFYAIPDEGGDY